MQTCIGQFIINRPHLKDSKQLIIHELSSWFYSMFALSWSYQRIQLVEFQECSTHTKEDATVMCLGVHESCGTERLTSRANTFELKCRAKHMLAYHETHFSELSK